MRYRERRWPCDHPIRLIGPAGPMTARMVNLSRLGARIVLSGLSVGDTFTLDLSPGRLSGTVRWARNGMVGVRFAGPMSARDMSHIHGHKGGRAAIRTERRTAPRLCTGATAP